VRRPGRYESGELGLGTRDSEDYGLYLIYYSRSCARTREAPRLRSHGRLRARNIRSIERVARPGQWSSAAGLPDFLPRKLPLSHGRIPMWTDAARRAVSRIRNRTTVTHRERHAENAQDPRAGPSALVRQAPRDQLQHRLPVEPGFAIVGLCGAGDSSLGPRCHYASLRRHDGQTAAQFIGFRHPQQHILRNKLERCRPSAQPARRRRGAVLDPRNVAAASGIVDVCRAHGRRSPWTRPSRWGTYGRPASGAQVSLRSHECFVVGTFSNSLAGIGGASASLESFPARALALSGGARTCSRVRLAVNVASSAPPSRVLRALPRCASTCGERRRLRQGAHRVWAT